MENSKIILISAGVVIVIFLLGIWTAGRFVNPPSNLDDFANALTES